MVKVDKQFHLNEEQLERLYPFYLAIDKELKITSFSAQLNKVTHLCKGVKVTEIFDVKPLGLLDTPIEELGGRIFQFIKAGNEEEHTAPFVIQGELLYLQQEQELLALGTPNIYFYKEPAERRSTQDEMTSLIQGPAKEDLTSTCEPGNAPMDQYAVGAHIAGVAITTAAGAIEWVSKDFELSMGCTLNDIKGMRPRDVIYGKDSTYIPSSFVDEMVQKKAIFSFENIGYNRFGKSFWFRTTVQPIIDGKKKITGRYYMFEDITNSKLKEDLYKHSYDLWRFAITGSGDGVWAYDTKTEKITVSERVKELLGLNSNDNIDVAIARNLIHQDDAAPVKAAVTTAISNNNPFLSFDARFMHQRSGYRYYRIRGKRIQMSVSNSIVFFGTITDVHSEKEKDLALKNAASRMEALLKNINFGILLETEDRKVSLINDELRSIFTIPYTDAELYGMDCRSMALQMDPLFYGSISFSDRVEQILQQKRPVIDELLFTTDNRVLERDYIPIFVNDIYNGHLWRYKDVTRRVTLERNLAASETRLTQLMNQLKQAVIFEDQDRNIIYVNDVLMRIISDYTSKQVEPKAKSNDVLESIKHIFANPGDELERIEAIVRNKEEVKNDIVHLSDGRVLSRHFLPLMIGTEESGYLWVYEDITESLTARKELVAQKEYYHRILNEIPADIVILTADNRFTFSNKSAIRDDEMREWIIGKTMVDYCKKRNINISFANEREQLFREVWRTQKAHSVIDHYNPGQENEKYILRVLYPFISADKKPEFLVVYGIDITEEKKNEQRAENERLANEKNLTEVIDRERELNVTKTQFIRITSHELRTPLAIIQANAELLQMTLKPAGTTVEPARQQNMLNRIAKEVGHMTELLNQLMLVSRMETGKLEFIPKPCNISQLIADIADDLFSPNSDGRHLRLHLPGNNVWAPADDRLLRHAIVNLVNNAFKYSPGAAQTPVLRLLEKDEEIAIEVEDFGIGIPEQDRGKLFTSFFRAGNTGNISGSGLGLTIVEYVTGLHGGRIELDSQVNKGTIFRIILNRK